jgi:hypothetical protein
MFCRQYQDENRVSVWAGPGRTCAQISSSDAVSAPRMAHHQAGHQPRCFIDPGIDDEADIAGVRLVVSPLATG